MKIKKIIWLIFILGIFGLDLFSAPVVQEVNPRRLVMFFDYSGAEKVGEKELKDTMTKSFAITLFQKGPIVCVVDETVLHHFLNKRSEVFYKKTNFDPAEWQVFYVNGTKLYVFFPQKYDYVECQNIQPSGISIFKEKSWTKIDGDEGELKTFVNEQLKQRKSVEADYDLSKIFITNKDIAKEIKASVPFEDEEIKEGVFASKKLKASTIEKGKVVKKAYEQPDPKTLKKVNAFDIVKNNFRPWSVVIHGHGNISKDLGIIITTEGSAHYSQLGAIGGLPEKVFQEQVLSFFNKLNTNFMLVTSCFIGGKNTGFALHKSEMKGNLPFLTNESLNLTYPLVFSGITEGVTISSFPDLSDGQELSKVSLDTSIDRNAFFTALENKKTFLLQSIFDLLPQKNKNEEYKNQLSLDLLLHAFDKNPVEYSQELAATLYDNIAKEYVPLVKQLCIDLANAHKSTQKSYFTLFDETLNKDGFEFDPIQNLEVGQGFEVKSLFNWNLFFLINKKYFNQSDYYVEEMEKKLDFLRKSTKISYPAARELLRGDRLEQWYVEQGFINHKREALTKKVAEIVALLHKNIDRLIGRVLSQYSVKQSQELRESIKSNLQKFIQGAQKAYEKKLSDIDSSEAIYAQFIIAIKSTIGGITSKDAIKIATELIQVIVVKGESFNVDIPKNEWLKEYVLKNLTLSSNWFFSDYGVNSIPQLLLPGLGVFSGIQVDPEIFILNDVVNKKAFFSGESIKIQGMVAVVVDPERLNSSLEIFPIIRENLKINELADGKMRAGTRRLIEKGYKVLLDYPFSPRSYCYYPMFVPRGTTDNYFFNDISVVPYIDDGKKCSGILHFIRDAFLNPQGRTEEKTFYIKKLKGFNDFLKSDGNLLPGLGGGAWSNFVKNNKGKDLELVDVIISVKAGEVDKPFEVKMIFSCDNTAWCYRGNLWEIDSYLYDEFKKKNNLAEWYKTVLESLFLPDDQAIKNGYEKLNMLVEKNKGLSVKSKALFDRKFSQDIKASTSSASKTKLEQSESAEEKMKKSLENLSESMQSLRKKLIEFSAKLKVLQGSLVRVH